MSLDKFLQGLWAQYWKPKLWLWPVQLLLSSTMYVQIFWILSIVSLEEESSKMGGSGRHCQSNPLVAVEYLLSTWDVSHPNPSDWFLVNSQFHKVESCGLNVSSIIGTSIVLRGEASGKSLEKGSALMSGSRLPLTGVGSWQKRTCLTGAHMLICHVMTQHTGPCQISMAHSWTSQPPEPWANWTSIVYRGPSLWFHHGSRRWNETSSPPGKQDINM